MKLAFTKMHGLGNDFVVFDFTEQHVELTSQQALAIADRKFGVGCDQILIVERSDRSGIDFKYRIINSDGSEVEQCGNGARCFARFVHEKGLSDKNPLQVETKGGDIQLELSANGQLVTVNMGAPSFKAEDVPIASSLNGLETGHGEQSEHCYSMVLNQQQLCFYAVSIGNPHAVLVTDDIDTVELHNIGPALQNNAIFPEKANIGFMQIIDKATIKLRVFERGVGETLACGTGACAAVVAGIKAGLLASEVTVSLPAGNLEVVWRGPGSSIMMTGPATTVFQGELEL